ncbi:MAG: GntR family transcriptional regulator [Symbiobacteriaceae bacterium]|nr:GntR family transcriptional regulator [Symbiobacteriaceae bacterium]
MDCSVIILDKRNGIPLYMQLVEQLRSMILSGHLNAGDRLATERELSQCLGISRNTVSLAYKELERQGLIISRQGNGTYVADLEVRLPQDERREQLLNHVDQAIDHAAELGYTLEEFTSIVSGHIKGRQWLFRNIHMVFIECNREQTDYFAHEIELGSGVTVEPLLLETFEFYPEEAREVISTAELIVTTFYHLNEVRALLPHRVNDIIGIALEPLMDTVVRIARLPKEHRIGLVTLSEKFAEGVRKSIKDSGIPGLTLIRIQTQTEEQFRDAVKPFNVLIVSPGRKSQVESLTSAMHKEIIEFIYRPDQGSINLLKNALLKVRNTRNEVNRPRDRSRIPSKQ